MLILAFPPCNSQIDLMDMPQGWQDADVAGAHFSCGGMACSPGLVQCSLTIISRGESMQSSTTRVSVLLVCAVRRSRWIALYSVLIPIDSCFMLARRMERSTMGKHTAWRGTPRRYLTWLCRAVFVCVLTRRVRERRICSLRVTCDISLSDSGGCL